jgi:hypothetical protein
MGCLLALFAMISPRFAIFVLWLFDNDRMSRAFTSGWIAIIGFLFLPWTTLAWAVCYAWPLGVSGFGYLVVGFAFFVDLASYGSGARERQRRAQYA